MECQISFDSMLRCGSQGDLLVYLRPRHLISICPGIINNPTPEQALYELVTMIPFLVIALYLSVHSVYAQLTDQDQTDKSCDLGHFRSIWNIIWSCLVTIFSCTWLAVHLNVPKQEKGKLWKLGRRAFAFMIALIAPEFIVMQAWDERLAAKKLLATLHNGIFVVFLGCKVDSILVTDYNVKWTLTHCFFANMGGFMAYDTNHSKEYVLRLPDEISVYLRHGQINTKEEDIQDKSKGDMLTKGFAVLQTTWFIVQLVARAIQSLPITELEVATLAFAILNGITYVLWWNKPLDVQRPIFLHHTPSMNVDSGADRGTDQDSMEGGYLNDELKTHLLDQQPSRRRVSSVPLFNFGRHGEIASTSSYILSAMGVLFGGIHCIAWFFHFPTLLEKLLWQAACFLMVILPAATVAFTLMVSKGGSIPGPIMKFAFSVLFVLYTIARLFLFAFAFTTLRDLPPDTYTTVHWTTFVPHM